MPASYRRHHRTLPQQTRLLLLTQLMQFLVRRRDRRQLVQPIAILRMRSRHPQQRHSRGRSSRRKT